MLNDLHMWGILLTFKCCRTGRLTFAQGQKKWAVPCVALALLAAVAISLW